MDNEPSICSAWLYNFSGRPFKTQDTVRQVLNTLWSSAPGGMPGQDDLGAMSAWYVWSAMGMHPLTPGRAELLLSSALFPQVVVSRSNGRTITINAPGASASTKFVQSLQVNGTTSNRSWLPESFVANGGTLDYTLGTTANTSWGAAAADAPPSFDSGGTSDKWCSLVSGTKFLQVDLGSTRSIVSFTVRHAGAGGESTTWNTRDFDIQVSADGTSFTTVVQVRGNTASVTNHTMATSGRFVRLNVITAEQGTGGAARIYEFEVYA